MEARVSPSQPPSSPLTPGYFLDRYELLCPLADGGKDDATNIQPKTPEDHVQGHKDNGDFKRWGARSKKDPPKKEPEQQP